VKVLIKQSKQDPLETSFLPNKIQIGGCALPTRSVASARATLAAAFPLNRPCDRAPGTQAKRTGPVAKATTSKSIGLVIQSAKRYVPTVRAAVDADASIAALFKRLRGIRNCKI
jgi:hypothetical protein